MENSVPFRAETMESAESAAKVVKPRILELVMREIGELLAEDSGLAIRDERVKLFSKLKGRW